MLPSVEARGDSGSGCARIYREKSRTGRETDYKDDHRVGNGTLIARRGMFGIWHAVTDVHGACIFLRRLEFPSRDAY